MTDLSSNPAKTSVTLGEAASHMMAQWGQTRQPFPWKKLRVFPLLQAVFSKLSKTAAVDKATRYRIEIAKSKRCSCQGLNECSSCDRIFEDVYS